jgi:hypothetical protein
MADEHHSRVGYRQPPAEHRFKPGTSGNPKGRPKRKQPALKTVINDELNKPVNVRQNGETQTLSALEAIIRRTVQDAMAGTPTERRLALRFLSEHLPPETLTPMPPQIVVRFGRHDEDL